MNTSALALPLTRHKAIEHAYLKFQLSQSVAAVLPMKQVQEVLVIPMQRLTSIPNMPACVLGLINRRSQVLWLVDLGHFLGIHALGNVRQYHLMIVRLGSAVLGLAVQNVEGMVWLEPSSIQPPPGQLPTELVGYLDGCVLQEQTILWMLNSESILRSSLFHSL